MQLMTTPLQSRPHLCPPRAARDVNSSLVPALARDAFRPSGVWGGRRSDAPPAHAPSQVLICARAGAQ
jgi:hypothetical protein